MAKLSEYLASKKGEPVAILCMRYWYRGILSEVEDDFIVLENALAIEQTGPAAGDHAVTEDPIPSAVVIKTMAIEIVCWPTWCYHGFKTNAPAVKKAK